MSGRNQERSAFKRKYKVWRNDITKQMPARTKQRYQRNDVTDDDLNHGVNESENMNVEAQEMVVDEDNYEFHNYSTNSKEVENDRIERKTALEFCIDENFFSWANVENDNNDVDNEDDDFDDSDDDDNNEDNDSDINMTDGEEALYNGCEATVLEISNDLLEIFIKNRITKAALKGFLKILNKVLPNKHHFPTTLHRFFKFIDNQASIGSAQKHYYCQICRAYIDSDSGTFCPSCQEERDLGTFYELDISHQIKFLFEHHNLASKLEEPAVRTENIIRDLKDGSEYKRVNLRENRQLHDLTLMLNTDGLSLVKSANSHCWPLMFMIAELPPQLRQYYLVTIGLWYDDKHKPLMNTFLRPFSIKFNHYYQTGIDWIHPMTKEICNSKIVVPLIIADAPARADLLNMQGHNGMCACNICEMRRQQCKKKYKKRKISVFSHQEKQAELRTSTKMISQAEHAERTKQNEKVGPTKMKKIHVQGIQGHTILSTIMLLDIATCFVPEYMHSILLGVVKQFLNIWIKKKGLWNLNPFKEEIENFIKNIKPPSHFHRMPRSIFSFHFFKAHEFYNWLLYYSIPTLKNVLPEEHFQHWMLLVTAIFKLLQENITTVELEQADICLRLFVRDIEVLYSDREYTYNVHQLLHLVLCVQRWGPLWATSAFPFENYNGFLANCVHGSKNQAIEMIKNIRLAQAARALKNSYIEKKTSYVNNANIILLGAPSKQLDFIHFAEQEVLNLLNIDITAASIHRRANVRGRHYTSEIYKVTKTNSAFVKIKINGEIIYGLIRFFCEYKNCFLVMVQHLEINYDKRFVHEESGLPITHILPFEKKNQFSLYKIVEMEDMTHLIKVGDYICEQPNQLSTVT